MTTAEYAAYERAVREFFESEGIENLSGGYIRCPECKTDLDLDRDYPTCPDCGQSWINEPFFSWSPCECCGTHLGGDREHATGYNRDADRIQEYDVCTDCIYYAEYGRLDDTTMDEIEGSD